MNAQNGIQEKNKTRVFTINIKKDNAFQKIEVKKQFPPFHCCKASDCC